MTPETAAPIYQAYLAIFDMRLRDGIRREMLTWALTENADHWPVIGVTRAALDRFAEHDFKCVSGMKIQRAHLSDRRTWQSEMLQTRLSLDNWLDLYNRSDKTVLATSSENMKGMALAYMPIPTELQMFRSTGYKWRHGTTEREYLRALHAKCAGTVG